MIRGACLERKFLHCMGLGLFGRAKAANCREFGGLTPGPSETNCKPFIHLALPEKSPGAELGADPAASRVAFSTSYMHWHAGVRPLVSGKPISPPC